MTDDGGSWSVPSGRSRAVRVAVCLAVVLAGCGGSTGGGPTEPDDLEFAAGYSEDGIETRTALETHIAALENSTYRMRMSAESGDRSVEVTKRRSDAGAMTNTTIRDVPTQVWESGNRTVFKQGTGEYAILGTAVGPELALGRVTGVGGVITFDQEIAAALLDGIEYNYTGAVRRDGDRLHRYVPQRATPNATGTAREATSVNGTLLVDEAGRIRDGDIRLVTINTVSESNETTTTRIQLSLTNVGESIPVTEPAWTEQAPSVSVSVSEGIVAITNTGEEPFGGTVSIGVFQAAKAGLDPLSPGETAYVAPTDDGITVTRDRPDPAAPDDWRTDRVAIRIRGDRTVLVGVNFTGNVSRSPRLADSSLASRSFGVSRAPVQ